MTSNDPVRRPPATAAPLVGILGGMGPAATVDLYQKIIDATDAEVDQEHLRVMIWADPTVPDRTAALTGGGEDPTPWLVDGARRLREAGAAFYVMACNGAHAFLPRIREQVDLECLSIIETTADHLASAEPRPGTVGLLATDATLAAGLYQRALRGIDVDVVTPKAEDQRTVMSTIFAVKAGTLFTEQRAALQCVVQRLVDSGAEAIIAGCTEIPLALDPAEVPRPVIDPAVLLARRVVDEARRRTG